MSAPDVSYPNNGGGLASAVPSSTPQMPSPQSPGSPEEQDMDAATSGPQNGPSGGGGGGRLRAILSAVASVGSTALAGTPSGARPSFLGSAANGARAEIQQQANNQGIKMQDFENSLRLANLHNADQELQSRTQEQQDAHQKFQDFQSDYDEAHGIEYNPHPNSGDAVLQTLKGQTAANGSASIAPGTHLSADGKSINVPSDSPDTQKGQLDKYSALQGILPGVPNLPHGAQFVPSKNQDVLTHVMGGYDVAGNPLSHDQLKNMIPALQAQRDNLAKNDGTPYQLGTLDNLIGVYKANEKNHSDAEDAADAKAAKQKGAVKAAEVGAETSPTAIQGAADKAGAIAKAEQPYKIGLQDNAAGNKAATGSGEWKQGVTASQKNKTDLAENMAANINSVNSILAKRPDLVGAVAGRFTTTEQMIGNNDPDIAALGTAIHNIGMANNGIHGMKANEGVKDFEALTLNHFKNGPQAIGGALNESAKSVQTFIDAARPDTYKTSTAQGGALKAMGASGGTPQTHSFSLGAWQRANPNGDSNAASAAAQKQGFTVVQ